MEIDVIIPLFNGSAFIRETLASVFMQTFAPSRIIVVDDGSRDDSFAIVSRVPGVCAVKSPSKGSAAARNAGLRLATAPFVAFLDHDDLWHPEHLARLRALLREHPSHAFAASGMKSFDDTRTPRFDTGDGSPYLFDPWAVYPTHDLACTPSITLYRRDALLAAGGWPEEHDTMSDYSLWMRLAVERPIIMTRASTVAYRVHPHSVTASLKRDPDLHLRLSLRVDDRLKEIYDASTAPAPCKATVLRRNRIAHYTIGVVRLLASDNRAALLRGIDRLAQALSPEPLPYRQSLLYRLVCLHRDLRQSRETHSIETGYIALLDAWPKSDTVSRQALCELLAFNRPGLPFFMRYYAKRPADLERLRPLAAAVRRKFAPQTM